MVLALFHLLSNKQSRNSCPETTQRRQEGKTTNMHLCVVQEERIELLDKLEQFPLKIRVKEEQESILRWAGCCIFSATTTFVQMSCTF